MVQQYSLDQHAAISAPLLVFHTELHSFSQAGLCCFLQRGSLNSNFEVLLQVCFAGVIASQLHQVIIFKWHAQLQRRLLAPSIQGPTRLIRRLGVARPIRNRSLKPLLPRNVPLLLAHSRHSSSAMYMFADRVCIARICISLADMLQSCEQYS